MTAKIVVLRSILTLFFFCPWIAFGQPMYQFVQGIPVSLDGQNLVDPFAGGLNGIQPGMLDVDGDLQTDLVVFERFVRRVLIYRRTPQGFQHDPFLADLFPKEVSDWMLIRDFNGDGAPDLFTGDPLGIRVFVNTSETGSPVRWRSYHPGSPLLTKGFTSNINLKVNPDDVPAIDDLDGDGDLDFLVTQFSGNSTIEYHRNLSMERTGRVDSMQLERITQSWGGVEECGCGSFAFNERCPDAGGRTLHTGGKSLLTLDVDADGDKDLILGEEDCRFMHLLVNKGSAETAAFDSFEPFAITTDIHGHSMDGHGQMYASAFLADLDADRDEDLIVSTNLSNRTTPEENLKSNLIWFSNQSANRGFKPESQHQYFLQPTMLDFGDQAVVAPVDIDGDGDTDLLTGTYNQGLVLVENTGSFDSPEFRVHTYDYLGLLSQGLLNIRPQFADLTGDGRLDLVLTATESSSSLTSLWLYPNTAEIGFRAQAGRNLGFPLQSHQEKIRLRDINRDGQPDLLRFNALGELEFYRNDGQAKFTLEKTGFAGLGENPKHRFAPFCIADLDANGEDDLIIGDGDVLTSIPDFQTTTVTPMVVQVVNPLIGQSDTLKTIGPETPSVAYLFGQSQPTLILGTPLGGMRLLRPATGNALATQPRISLYPNPLDRQEVLRIASDRPGTATLYTVQGQRLGSVQITEPGKEIIIPVPDSAVGVYLVRFVSGKGEVTARLIRI